MVQSIKNSIYQAITENKWLDISYVNSNNENTFYFIGIKNIDIEKEKISCEIFNAYKNTELLPHKGRDAIEISLKSIKQAKIIENSYFECDASLKERIYFKENSYAGIFIYTACGDSEGSLGGLVRQGHADVFPRIFNKALEEMNFKYFPKILNSLN